MTNRRLKRKIRQAFQNATPDLAESVAVSSLFADVNQNKKEQKLQKTIKTPIQFRALATLAASIAVVALFATVVSMLNPFVPSVTPTDPLSTNPSNGYMDDVVINDPGYSFEEMRELKEYLFEHADIPFNINATDIGVTSDSWEGTTYHIVVLTETSGDNVNRLYFFLEMGSTTNIYPYDPDVDLSKYVNYYLGTPDENDQFYHQVVLADSRVRYALVADYGASGKFVLIDAETENVVEQKTLSGSAKALSIIAQENNFVGVNYRDYDCNFMFVDGTPCFEINYRVPVKLYALFDAASHRFIKKIYDTIVVDPTTDATEDPLNTEGPPVDETSPTPSYIGELKVYMIVRDHLGIEQLSQIDDYYFSEHLDSALPYYELIIGMDDYKYVYQIDAIYGNILKLDRTYGEDLKGKDLYKVVIDEAEALQIATRDPILMPNTGVSTCIFKTESGVSFYSIYLTDSIYWYRLDVSSALGIVLNAQVANRLFYQDVDDGYYIDTIYPTDSTDPTEGTSGDTDSTSAAINEMQALDIALSNAGLKQNDVTELELTLDPSGIIPLYEIEFMTADYEYEYKIAVRNGIIICAEREYNHDLDDDILNSNHVALLDAEQIVREDSMVKDSFKYTNGIDRKDADEYYEFRWQGGTIVHQTDYQYVATVSADYGIVTRVEITYRDVSPLWEESMTIANISPRPTAPNGMLGAYQALDLALEHLGYTAGNVGRAECSVNGQGFADSYHVYLTAGYINWEVAIDKYTGAIQMVTSSDSSVTPPDGKISKDDAIDAAMRYAGLNVNAAGYLECNEGDDPNFASYYDVTFYFGGYKWHYYIGMYNHQLLHIEKIPLD